MSDLESLKTVSTVIISGVTAFLGAGAKFVSDIKGIQDKVIATIKADITDKLDKRLVEVEKRLTEAERQVSVASSTMTSNFAGWRLEIADIHNDIEDLREARTHSFRSTNDYHDSSELVQRIEQLERRQKSMLTKKQLDTFIALQNEKAMEVQRLLGQIEGELKARFAKGSS